MSTDVLFPVGRLVNGHPMEPRGRTDDNDRPILDTVGVQVTERYIAVAIPKAGEQHWNQTEWGAKMWSAAQDPSHGYPNGEFNAPSFSWKIVDGDSRVPNKKGRLPCENEGWVGHWVIHMTTQMAYGCYHAGRYDPIQAIKDKAEIKRGDYCRVMCQVKGNKPSKSPGIYVNPQLFELTRAGIEIVSAGFAPPAANVFGAVAAVMPAGALIDTAVVPSTPPMPPAAPAAPVAPSAPPPPAHDLLVPPAPPVEEKYSYNGATYTKAQLLGMPGWTEDLIATHCTRV